MRNLGVSPRLVAAGLTMVSLWATSLSCFPDYTDQPPRKTSLPKRNVTWAKPISRPGLPNFHKVSDNLYRGAQPTAQGMRELERMGIRTVINLRSFSSDRDELERTSLSYEHIYMKAWHAESKELVRFLRIVTDPARTPVFVHCKHGADRTGTMSAIYRIAVQGWTKDDAIDEMTQGGFNFHSIWGNLPKHIRNLDVDELKRRANLPTSSRG